MKRFNITESGYKYDKIIFWGLLFLIIFLVFSIAKENNFDFRQKFYFKCDNINGCPNPIVNPNIHIYNEYTGQNYKDSCIEDWCKQEILMMGEYGTPPPDSFLFNHFKLITFTLFIFSFLLNHFVHNMGKVPDIEIKIFKWRINKRVIKEALKKFDKFEE